MLLPLCLRSRFRNYVLHMTWPTVQLDAQSVTSTCMYANVCQCRVICDGSAEYGGKLSIVSVIYKVCFKHHFNDCLKESGRISLFKLVMASYQWILGFIVN